MNYPSMQEAGGNLAGTTAKAESPIANKLGQLGRNIEELARVAQLVENHFGSVLSPPRPRPRPEGPETPPPPTNQTIATSGVGQTIDEANSRIRDSVARLQDTLSRNELPY